MSRKEDRIPATLRSFAVLEALVAAERPASLTEIVKAAALPKPTVYRMLAMLESAGLPRNPRATGRADRLSYKSYTPSTLADRKSLDAELARIRKARYATDNEEFHAGLVCVAVPTRNPGGRPCAAIAVHAPMSRMPLERALSYLPLLRNAAQAMEATFSNTNRKA